MKKPFLPFFLMVFGLIWANCKLNKPSADIDFQAPTEFSIDLFERIDSTSGATEAGLIFRSFKNFPCKNTGLKTRVGWVGDSATVEILEIAQPVDCEAGSEPIEQFVALGPLQNGRHRLAIVLGASVVNAGSMSVSDAEILLDMDATNGILVNHSSLRRVPAEAIWGKISFASADSDAAAKAFLAALDSLTAAPDYNFGFYGQFSLAAGAAAQVDLDRPAGLDLSRDFVRQSSRAAADFDWLLQKFRGDAAALLDIQFWTKKGAR